MSTENKVLMPANMTELPDDTITTETLDGTITSWNKVAEQIYSHPVKEILGKPMSILEPSILFEEIKELTELIKQGDRIHYHKTLQMRKDGKIIDVSQTISTIFDTSENPIAVLIIARDRKSFEEKKKFQVEFRFRRRKGNCIYAKNSREWLKNNVEGAFRDLMEYIKPCRDMQSHRVFKDITDWKLSIKN